MCVCVVHASVTVSASRLKYCFAKGPHPVQSVSQDEHQVLAEPLSVQSMWKWFESWYGGMEMPVQAGLRVAGWVTLIEWSR